MQQDQQGLFRFAFSLVMQNHPPLGNKQLLHKIDCVAFGKYSGISDAMDYA